MERINLPLSQFTFAKVSVLCTLKVSPYGGSRTFHASKVNIRLDAEK